MKYTYKRIRLAAFALCFFGAASASAEEFLVGAEIPLTGSLARIGSGINEGISVAVEVFNKTNAKHKIKMVTVDDESAPAKAVAAVEKLAGQGVVAITGGYGSNNIAPASDAANKLGLPYITSGGVDDSLTARGYKTFFRINNNVGYEKAVVGLVTDLKVKSASIVFSTREAPANVANDVQKTLTAKGLKIGMHPFDPAITDFKPIINKVKLQDKPEVILMVGYENDYVGILRAAKVLKPEVKAMIGVWSLATPQMASQFPDLMQSVYGSTLMPYPTEFKTPEGKLFADTYKKVHNKEPDYAGQLGYVQATVLFEAIARAADKGTLKKGGLAEELRKIDHQTPIGRVQFNDKGDNPNFVLYMAQHQNGKIVIVWPSEASTGTMKFPGVPW
jgi:branched-chain amino acid transport system substrate-binding protein